MKGLAAVGFVLLSALMPGCAHNKETPSFVSTGNDKLVLSEGDAGFAYYDSNGNPRLAFMDPDHDGSADYLRIHSLEDRNGCSVTVEDYETDGTLDMRLTSCKDRDKSKIELNVEGAWVRIEKGDGGPTIVIKGVRRRVLSGPHGWLRVGDAV